MRVGAILCLVGVTTAIGCATHRTTSEVVVRDSGFQDVRTISEASDISTFDEQWRAKSKVDEPQGLDWQYKLDIRAGHDVVRWLYDPSGYTRVLAMKKSPTWQLSDSESFNAMLGLSNNRVQSDRAKPGR